MKSGAAVLRCFWLPPFAELLSRGSQVRVLPGGLRRFATKLRQAVLREAPRLTPSAFAASGSESLSGLLRFATTLRQAVERDGSAFRAIWNRIPNALAATRDRSTNG